MNNTNMMLLEKIRAGKKQKEFICSEIEKHGGSRDIYGFISRMMDSPLYQTKAFIEYDSVNKNELSGKRLKSWKAFLEVYIEKYSDDNLTQERKEALMLIKKYNNAI